jgi:hypothetical protein
LAQVSRAPLHIVLGAPRSGKSALIERPCAEHPAQQLGMLRIRQLDQHPRRPSFAQRARELHL